MCEILIQVTCPHKDIQHVLDLRIAGILFIFRMWFKTIEEPIVIGSF